MKYKSWVRKLAGSVCIFVVFIVGFNFTVDPYAVFNIVKIEGFNKTKNYISNDARTKFYSAKSANPEILLIGTSRTENINPKHLSKYNNRKIYNMAIKGSGVTLHKKNIEYMIKNFPIKKIIYGLDLFSFNPVANDFNNDLTKTRYNDYYVSDYLDVLFGIKPFERAMKTLKGNIKNEESELDIETGWGTNVVVNKKIKNGGIDFLKENTKETIYKKFITQKHTYNFAPFKQKESIEKSLKVFDEIVELCNKNDIELYLFISPFYNEITDLIYSRGYGETLEYWKNSLSKYPNVIDFSGYNSITLNIENFVDGSHYNDNVAHLIVAKLFKDKEVDVPNDFGNILKYKVFR